MSADAPVDDPVDESAYDRWLTYLAQVSAPVDLERMLQSRLDGPLAVPVDPELPPLPPELATAVGRALQTLRGRLGEIARERDLVARELDQLARSTRSSAGRRPVYLDATG